MACEMEVETSCRNYLDFSELSDQKSSSLTFAQGIPQCSPCLALARIGGCSYRNSNDAWNNSATFSRLQSKGKRKNLIEIDSSTCGKGANILRENIEPPSKVSIFCHIELVY